MRNIDISREQSVTEDFLQYFTGYLQKCTDTRIILKNGLHYTN